tara:strand:- start:722 stop:1201 length:480 start_codon:yes stop_codon:yes gene_type:complete
MLLIKNIVVSIICLVCIPKSTHIEDVMTLNFKQESETQLSLNISLTKDYMSVLKMFNSNVSSENQSLLVHQMLKNAIEVIINEKNYDLNLNTIISNDRGYNIQYTIIGLKKEVKSIKVNTQELIQGFDNHAQIAVKLNLNNRNRLFKIKKERESISIYY